MGDFNIDVTNKEIEFDKLGEFCDLFNLTNLSLLTVCSCHVTYAFQSESALHSCQNVKEILARSRREIWSLSGSNWTPTHNHLVHKRTLNHLAKLASVRLWTKWLWIRVQLQSLDHFSYVPLRTPLSIAINNSFKYSIFPSNAKVACVKPLDKKTEDKHCISNFRPVSILITFDLQKIC